MTSEVDVSSRLAVRRLGSSLAVWATLSLLSVVLFVRAMSGAINVDEEQYVAAAALNLVHRLYSDFVYLQPPIYPHILAFLFGFFDPSQYFLAARLLTWVLSVGSLLLIYGITCLLTKDRFAGLAIALLFATSAIGKVPFSTARNDIMPCFFALAGLYFFFLAAAPAGIRADIRAGEREHPAPPIPRPLGLRLLYFLCGLSLALAVGSKALYAFVPAVLFFYVLFSTAGRGWSAHYRQVVLPLTLGGLLGGLPLIFHAVSDWDRFFYGLVTYHRIVPLDWYARNGYAHLLTFDGQVRFFLKHLGAGTALGALIFCAVCLGVTLQRGRLADLLARLHGHRALAIPLLFLISVPFCAIPLPGHTPYLLPILILLLLTVAAFYATLPEPLRPFRRAALAAVTAISILPFGLILAAQMPKLGKPQSWAVQRVQGVGTETKAALAEAGLEGKIATLSPLWVLGSGHPIYRELATGPFFFENEGLLSGTRVRELNGATPSTLATLLDSDPPDAIFVGFNGRDATFGSHVWKESRDAPFIAYAEAKGYSIAAGDFAGATLYLRLKTQP